jgi:hypothetical protein
VQPEGWKVQAFKRPSGFEGCEDLPEFANMFGANAFAAALMEELLQTLVFEALDHRCGV